VRLRSDKNHVSHVFQGTLSHMAPEVLSHGHVGKPADVYAMGVLLWELYTGMCMCLFVCKVGAGGPKLPRR
jgi:serine/threonine protein kinase